ncbi:stalk domain-containing protein [Brevibacillus sp. SYSU BS000544]|uniref:stalk domain-containing protein n=1 Tax=Brevibacillus sp. SYSU BS000544 TaxID=3416443 RepID=UPI003CE4E5B3
MLKKIAALLLCLGMLTAVIIPAQAQTTMNLQMGGKYVQLTKSLKKINNRTMISIDDAAKLLFGTVKKQNKVVTLTVGSVEFGFDTSAPQIRKNSTWIKVDQGAILDNGTVYIPLRWVLEQLSFTVGFNAQTQTITVNSQGKPDEFHLLEMSSLNSDEKKFIEEVRKTRGVHQQGELVVIALGSVPNPGYGIEFDKQKGSWEQVRIFVKLTNPQPGQMYPQVISYPYLVGKIKLAPYTTIEVVDSDTRKTLFQAD